MRFLVTCGVALSALTWATTTPTAEPSTPQSVVESLLQADRDFAARALKQTPQESIVAMLWDAALMPLPTGTFARGKAAIRAALADNPDNTSGYLEWFPIRGGVSADGLHGFTVGYNTQRRTHGPRQTHK